MAHENFAKLSETLTINLDKIITIEWSQRTEDRAMYAVVTFDRGNRTEYTGVAAENLKQVLGHTFDHEKRTNGVEIHAAN